MARRALSLVVLSGLLLAAPAVAQAPGAGEVSGTVRFEGAVPAAAPLPVTKDHRACGETQPDESLVVGKQGLLANTVVFLADAPAPATASAPAAADAGAPTPADVVLDQVGCRYTPHVSAAQVGAKLVAVNSDPVLHNVRGNAVENRRPRFNVAMPMRNQRRPLPLPAPGLINVRCDAGHPWMNAWVYVFPHRHFAVTGADGAFRLPEVPPGNYTLETWHEKLGKQTAKVRVEAGKVASVQLSYP